MTLSGKLASGACAHGYVYLGNSLKSLFCRRRRLHGSRHRLWQLSILPAAGTPLQIFLGRYLDPPIPTEVKMPGAAYDLTLP